MEYFVQLTTKISKLPKGQINDQWIKFQQQNRTNILSFVKILKKDEVSHLKICEMKSEELTSLTQCFIDFVSKKQSYESKIFLQALAALDCILSCSPGTFSKVNFNNAFCSNIRKFFSKLCDQYQNVAESQQEMTLKFQFYTVFYIIVILVYQSGKGTSKQVKKIPLQIMNKAFISNLLEFEAPKKSKIRKLISFLILYLVKKGNMKQWGKKLTYYILNNFQIEDNRKTIFNYIFCLRELNNNCLLDDKEVKKYELINKLKKIWIEYFNDYQSYYILDLVQQILKIDPIFCQDFCDSTTIDLLGVPQKMTNIHPSFSEVSIEILEVSSLYLNKDLFKKNLLLNLNHWNSSLLSLKYVKIFIEAFTEKQIIEFLHTQHFSELKQILIHKDENYRTEGIEIVKRIIQKLSTINVNIMNSFYFNFHEFIEWNETLSLQNKKQMLDRIQYYYQRKFQDYSGFSLF